MDINLMQNDQRVEKLVEWLKTINIEPTLQLITGDASFRRYFRISTKVTSYIVMDSPPELIDLAPFVSMANAYHANGIYTADILAINYDQGFILLSDLGDTWLLNVLTLDNVKDFYTKSLEILPKVSQITSTNLGNLPKFDQEFIQREFLIFKEWFINRHLQIDILPDEELMLANLLTELIENIKEQPQVGMHRDFHSRNLMIYRNKIAVIDFQDAVIGPVTYDAVSLLRDCYIQFNNDIVYQMLKVHHQVMKQSIDFDKYCYWFDLTGLQRHLKVLGIFARLYYRDGKKGYLKDLPITLEYVLMISGKYPQLDKFNRWLLTKIKPLFETTKV